MTAQTQQLTLPTSQATPDGLPTCQTTPERQMSEAIVRMGLSATYVPSVPKTPEPGPAAMSDPAKVSFNATYQGKTWALYGKQYTSEQITEWFEAAYGFKPDMIMEIGGGKLAGPKPEKPQITTVEIEREAPAPVKRRRKNAKS